MGKKSLLPFLILGAGFVWMAVCEWLRKRSQQPGGADPAAPQSQRFLLIGAAGLMVCMIAAAIAAYVKWFPAS